MKGITRADIIQEEIEMQAPIMDWRALLSVEDQAVMEEYLLTTGVKTTVD